jgi:uncharacterized phiE125 gp8 family phage protein
MIKVITAPTSEPITLAEAKANLRVIGTDDDADIGRMIRAARQMAESVTNRFLMPQTVEEATDFFPWGVMADLHNFFGEVPLRAAPLASAASVIVKYIDGAGVQQTLAPSAYIVNDYTDPAALTPAYSTSWPVAQLRQASVTIRYQVGYADAASVPEPIRQWMLLAIGAFYEHRSMVNEGQTYALPDEFYKWLLQPYVVYL